MDESNTFLRAALAQAERGRLVFPLGVGSKLPKIPKSAGGRGFHDATTDPDQIRAWWERWLRANLGIHTGRASNLVVLDVDPRHRGDQSLEALEAKYGQLPDTLRVRTAGDGDHYYFAFPDVALRNSASVLDDGLDIRAEGGYVVAPPSIVGGRAYTWLDEWGHDLTPVAPMPGWLVRLLRKPAARTVNSRPVSVPADAAARISSTILADRARQVATAPERRRNNTLNVAAYVLGTLIGSLDESEVWGVLTDAARRAGLDDREIAATIASGLSAGMARRRWSR